MHNPNIQIALGKHFTAAEVQQIVEFLERGFSPRGEAVVAGIFSHAKENGKQLAEVLEVCEQEWKGIWQNQNPDTRGDPAATGVLGIQNHDALGDVYNALGISNPIVSGKKIFNGSMVVKTHKKSTYRLGQADENGDRSITGDGKTLPFARGKVIFLVEGEKMHLIGEGKHWLTSWVEEIIPG